MSFIERRRSGFDRELLARAGLAWLLVCCVLLLTNAVVILALRPQSAQAAAMAVAAVAEPLIVLGLAMLLAGRIAWRLVGPKATSYACLAMALSVPVLSALQPLRSDSSGWQIVLVLIALNAMMARSARWGGWIAGGALAASLTLSPEGWPLVLSFAAIAALRWLRDRDRHWLVALAQGLAIASALLLAAMRGFGAAAACETIAPAHAIGFGWIAAGLTLLARLRPGQPIIVLSGMVTIAAIGLALFLDAAAPCLGASGNGSDAVAPLWHQPLATVLQTAIPPLVALWACHGLALRSRDWLRRWWREYRLLLGVALLMALGSTRSGAIAGAFAAVPLGWQICEWLQAAQRRSPAPRRVAALAAALIAMLPALPVMLFGLATPLDAVRQAPDAAVQPAAQ